MAMVKVQTGLKDFINVPLAPPVIEIPLSHHPQSLRKWKGKFVPGSHENNICEEH